jgi:hypothetical protein
MAARTSRTGTVQPYGEEERVLTPGGWRPKSSVHQIETGHHLSAKDGRLRKVHTATGKVVADLGEVASSAPPKRPRGGGPPKKDAPYPENGWIINSGWSNTSSTPISYFGTEWVVPPAPSSQDGQTLFVWNGLEQSGSGAAPEGPYVLQPVLQWGQSYNGTEWWGGNYWAIANWYVGSTTLAGPVLIPVNPGDSLQGIVTLIAQSAAGFNYTSSFAGYPTADLSVTDIAQLTWACETLEAYNLIQGSDYPATLMTAMTNIEIKLGDTEANITWATENLVTENGQHCVVVSNASPGGSVYLFYAQDPQNFYFVVDKSTFGTDEVKDVIASAANGVYSNAFWLVLEGYTPNWLAGATPTFAAASTFNGTNISGLTISADTATPIEYELGGPGTAYGDTVQRIRFAFDIKFANTNSFPAIGSENIYSLLADISIGGILSIEPETIFELVGGADPYFTNVDSGDPHAVFYLSQDLRAFTVNTGDSPLPGAQAFTSDPYASIQGFLYYLNNTPQYTQAYAPGLDPLNNLPNQTGYETGDTSVTALNSSSQQNYNFAIARVRLQGTGGTKSPNVRVFFRLWVAVSCDTDFQPSTTYLSQLGTSGTDSGLPVFPLASGTGLTDPSGQSLQTIPFFATDSTGSNDYNPNYLPSNPQADNNIQTIVVPSGQNSVYTYFGCFLDVYTLSNQLKFPGNHHCIVAQIAYDEAPIPTTIPAGAAPSPENSDKLAQRNLQITVSGNPGFPVTHRIPQTFDTRPSPLPIFQPDGSLQNYPDELMIDWGEVPEGSVASIYWPQVGSAQVLAIASKIYPTHCLSAPDPNTVQCTVTGEVTYIPIPNGPGQNFAGLFTVDLPNGIRTGNVFDVTVRRIVSRQVPVGISIPAATGGRDRRPLLNWRCVAGTFCVTIPVTQDAPLLKLEENLLSVLKWRFDNMPSIYRWHPVLQQYISYVSSRVKGLGGNPSIIPPSQTGIGRGFGHSNGAPYHTGLEFTGKVVAMVFDRFGDFDGFVLLTLEGREHTFRCHEHELEQIVHRAWEERILITVYTEHRDHHVPRSIVLRRTSWRRH